MGGIDFGFFPKYLPDTGGNSNLRLEFFYQVESIKKVNSFDHPRKMAAPRRVSPVLWSSKHQIEVRQVFLAYIKQVLSHWVILDVHGSALELALPKQPIASSLVGSLVKFKVKYSGSYKFSEMTLGCGTLQDISYF